MFIDTIEIKPNEVEEFLSRCNKSRRRWEFSQGGTKLSFDPHVGSFPLKTVRSEELHYALNFMRDLPVLSGERLFEKPIEYFPDAARQFLNPITKLSEKLYYRYLAALKACGLQPDEKRFRTPLKGKIKAGANSRHEQIDTTGRHPLLIDDW